MRPSFLRQVLSDETVEEMILTTPRLDLLVRAVDGYDHNHHRETRAFWECVGGLLRRRLGADRSGWTAAAAALPSHPGTFANLLRRIGKTPTPVPRSRRICGSWPRRPMRCWPRWSRTFPTCC
ncbi:hypothetical protein ACFQX6_48695 [Streptosporangium lutulentum]